MNPYRQVYLDILGKPNVEKLIDYLYGLDFRFVTFQFLKEYEFNRVDNLNPRFQYLVKYYGQPRLIDEKLTVGLDYFKRGNKIMIYRDGKLLKEFKLAWNKPLHFNMKEKKTPERYPPLERIDVEERRRWRKLHEWYKKGKEMSQEDLDFFMEFKAEIYEINGYED